MIPNDLINGLSRYIDESLANDIVSSFIELRKDCKTSTLGRSSAGKFIETVVQVLQYLETGTYDAKPKVDDYLRNLESRPSSLPDDLKICCSRIARSSYSLRNKRNIMHKGQVAPNIYDLYFTYTASQWMLSEIVRQIIHTDMAIAGRMIEFIQIPVMSVVERFGDRRLVYGKLTIEMELIILLHSYYPDYIPLRVIQQSLDRRSKSGISNALSKLWNDKFIHREGHDYVLTQEGFKKAVEILSNIS